MMRTLILLLSLALASPALAADFSVSLRTPSGQIVRDAVVTVTPAGAGPASNIKFPWPYEMAQQAVQFSPFILVVPVGAEVSFPNRDNVRHHVYSFSATKKFELKLYGHEESRRVRFDKPGVVALGCNIHDGMLAYIVVVETPFAGKSGTDGTIGFRNLPTGKATLTIWHPYMKTPKSQVVQTINVPVAGGRTNVVVDLRPGPNRS